MEPPSGNMDGDRLAKDNFIRANFSICDAADEEVHFSRYIVASGNAAGGYHYANYYPAQANGHHQQHSTNELADTIGHHQSLPKASTNQDQVKSNKLLQCIGSKLRRGSNYLAAPKLVGQYLLGITIQSWSEFLNTSRLMKAPGNTQQLTRRLLANLNHFQGNYMCVSLVLVIYCILTSPLLLIAIIAYLATLYLVTVRSATGRHLRIAGFRPNLQQQYSFITLISLPLLWVAGAPSAVFWVIGASFVVVGLHASMYSGELAVLEQAEYTDRGATNNAHQIQHYYNHTTSTPQHYIPVHVPLPTVEVATPKELATGGGTGSSSSYSSAISQWITFGGGGGGGTTSGSASKHQKVAPGGGSSSPSPASVSSLSLSATSTSRKEVRIPHVTIISQDYAGLGRVYEV